MISPHFLVIPRSPQPHTQKAGGNPNHDPIDGKFTTGDTGVSRATMQRLHEHRAAMREQQERRQPASGQLILSEQQARRHSESVNDHLDVHNEKQMQQAAQETGGSRIFNFSSGEGSDLDKNVKFATNTNKDGTFERGALRVEIHDPDTSKRNVYQRRMSELPSLVAKVLAKKYAATSQHRRNTQHVMKASGGNPNHDEEGKFASSDASGGDKKDFTSKVNQISKELGVTAKVDIVEHEGWDKQAADYGDGTITLYKGAKGLNDSQLKGVIAHEEAHHRLSKIDPSKYENKMRELASEIGESSFSNLFVDIGGVSPYSDKFWKSKELRDSDGRVNRALFNQAVRETLSEVARLKAQGEYVTPVWNEVYKHTISGNTSKASTHFYIIHPMKAEASTAQGKWVTLPNGARIQIGGESSQGQDKPKEKPQSKESQPAAKENASQGNAGEGLTHEQRKQIVSKIADKMGIDADSITVAEKDEPSDEIGEKMGEYDPSSGKITVYPNAFRSKEELTGTLAHEAQHMQLDKVLKAYNSQQKEFQAGAALNSDKLEVFLELKTVFAQENRITYERADGINKYSTLFWERHQANPSTKTFVNAISETLSEVARLDFAGKAGDVSPQMMSLFNRVNRMAKGL